MAKITQISSFGDVQIRFSEKTNLGRYQMELELQPNYLPEGFDMSKLDFFWGVKEFDGIKLDIKINFTNPVYISPNFQQDILFVRFLNVSNITAVKTLEPLDEKSWVLNSPIKKQIPDNEATQSFSENSEKFDKLLKITFFCAIGLNLLMAGSGVMEYFIEMLNSLQIVIHFPMLRILLPGNVTLFFKIIIPIVMFDILDGLDDTKYDPNNLIEFDENNDLDTDVFISQMSDLGYKTNNSIQNLGSMFFIICFYFIRVFLIVFFHLASKYTGKGQEALKNEKNRLFFNELILLLVEGYMELAISGYINYLGGINSDVTGEVLAKYTRYFCFVSVYVMAPCFFIYMLSQDVQTIESQEFQEKFGGLTEGLKTTNMWTLSYNLVFIVRRLLFCMVVFYMADMHVFQIYLIYICNFVSSFYSGHFNPREIKNINRLERWNEFLIQFCTVCLFFFTDYIPDKEIQYTYGFVLIAGMGLLMMSDLFMVFKVASATLFLVLKKYFNRIKPKKNEVEEIEPEIESISEIPEREVVPIEQVIKNEIERAFDDVIAAQREEHIPIPTIDNQEQELQDFIPLSSIVIEQPTEIIPIPLIRTIPKTHISAPIIQEYNRIGSPQKPKEEGDPRHIKPEKPKPFDTDSLRKLFNRNTILEIEDYQY